jgi:succinyl-diaminopimelate desuccinylase
MSGTAADLEKQLALLAQSMSFYEPGMLRALDGLCRIPSVKGPATATAPLGAETARALDFFLAAGKELGFSAVNLDNKAGYVEFGSGDPLIAILGHLDVVPAGENWTTPPFEPVIESDRIIGRGTTDDKGPVVAALFSMKSLADSGYRPRGRIRLIAGLDEESGCVSMDHYLQVAEQPAFGFTPDADFPVIYAEKGNAWFEINFPGSQQPGDPLRLIAAKAGSVPNMVPGSCSLVFCSKSGRQELTVTGTSAHGSLPWQGRNAISMAMLEAQGQLRAAGCRHPFVDFYLDAIGSSWRGEDFAINGEDESGPLTLNAGMLTIGGESSRLTLDIRYPVTWNDAWLVDKIKDKLAPYGASLTLLRFSPPLYVPKDSDLVKTLLSVYSDLTGMEASPIAIGGGTYARAMPGIVAFGPSFPGESDTAHQAGEQIGRTSFLAMAAIYREALRRLGN